MAIVRNAADGGTGTLDSSYCSPNRGNAGEPNGVLTPLYAGEIILDITNNCLWKSCPLAGGILSNQSWVALTTPN